ncbi:hypothetical protein IAU60_000821 [Kwoniella sp. DSM 27419]
MAPKSKTSKVEKSPSKRKRDQVEQEQAEEVNGRDSQANGNEEEAQTKPPAKSSKKSTKPTSANDKPKDKAEGTTGGKGKASAVEWLLSDEAFDLANPAPDRGYGEVDWAKHTSPANPKTAPEPLPKPSASSEEQSKADEPSQAVQEGIRYPHSPMTPFQILVCSLLLSKPLSHKLGIRTISTLLNPPFNFGTFEVLQDSSEERRREAMWKARTQHKEKTAVQLGDLADGVRGLNGEGEEDTLGGVKRAIEDLDTADAQKRVGDMLKSIKGIGPGGVGIFLRRVQKDWPEVFPYADDRCLAAARVFGLITEDEGAEQLAKVVDDDRGKLVRLLDTLIGLDLEKKLHEYAEQYA